MSALSPVLVSVPAGPDLLHILRAVVSSVAVRLDLPFDAVEEARVAVDEAASILLQLPEPRERFELRIETDDAELTGVLSIDARTETWPSSEAKTSWSWRVIAGVCDEAAFERTGRDPAIRFVKRGASR